MSASSTATTPERTGRLMLALFVLLVTTAVEVIVAGLPVDRTARITALCGLAMTKASILLVAFMRLGRQPFIVRLAILTPLVLGPGFAVAIMLDAAFRVTMR
ncbi:MAG TPA: cytochrome C oxidase subunit IV family protein [Polyangia bacterium]|jgi:cytochrome c oxidase subunit IV|nr:cytochrome C oxidase subunit IV family protein [Polyangia bacterium]